MSDYIQRLPELSVHDVLDVKKLPPLHGFFRVPRLEEKPQNPIIQTIQNNRKPLTHLPKELLLLTEGHTSSARTDVVVESSEQDEWTRATNAPATYKNHIASWDTLRQTYSQSRSPSPFITEQPPHVVAAARHNAYPRIFTQNEKLIYLSMEELIESVNSTLLGCSSVLHTWDPEGERFLVTCRGNKTVRVILDGMDEVISDSYLERFITIGTLLRRLDTLVLALRRSLRQSDSITYGFAHALSSVLVWVREEASKNSSALEQLGRGRISQFWLSFQELEDVLCSLADLCLRGVERDRESYGALPTRSAELLSHIFDHLSSQLQRSASRNVTSVLSYILTVTSRPYFENLSQSIGFEGLEHTLNNARNQAIKNREEVAAGIFSDGDEDAVEVPELGFDIESDDCGKPDEFPSFMTEELVEAVVRARRSIKIMSAPELIDALALSMPELRKLEWVWTEEEITSIELGTPKPIDSFPTETTLIHESPSMGADTTARYKPELAQLAIFDLEPGSTGSSAVTPSSSSQSQGLSTFLKLYPTSMPPLTPTLPILTRLVFSPVLKQSAFLSRAALQLFMDPSSPLHLRAHLVLLRSYLLLTSHAFKSRLSQALFSERMDDEDNGDDSKNRTRIGPLHADDNVEDRKSLWAVGLSFELLEKGQWPPTDSDVALTLRRVVMDSLEYVRADENADRGKRKKFLGTDEFWEGAESRIGFNTRGGTGKEKWSDPALLEAMDFVYMIYKPPPPLICLITEDIVSKYRRIFAFLLRLLRIESVMRLLFRSSRIGSPPSFYSSDAQKSLLNFRFAAQSFVDSLCSYVYDTAVGGNFNAFLARLASAEASPDLASHGYFSDVFSLMQRHSRVLDDILAACLLRSAQKALREILEVCLSCILEVGMLVGHVQKGEVDGPDAIPRLEDLNERFLRKRDLFIKALRRAADKGPSSAMEAASTYVRQGKEKRLPVAPKGMEALSILLTRLTGMKNVI